MKAIYAAKLYRASNRKEQIQSALEDPKNEKLVKQLARYLDDEYVPSSVPNQGSTEDTAADTGSQTSAGHSNPSPSPSHSSGGGYSGGLGDMADIELPGGEDGDVVDENLSEVEPGADEGHPSSTSAASPEVDSVEDETEVIEPEDTAVENSQSKLNGTNIVASIDIMSLPEEIRGTLNARQDCCGVNRVMVKDNELWIHYNDDVNLNNVMTSVIELFNAAGYTYLEFNRLARSANAIVFVSNMLDTNNNVKPVEEVDDQE